MKKSDLQFEFPDDLIAREPKHPSRICSGLSTIPQEISWDEFISQFQPNDLLVLNNTRVLRRRVFTEDGLEILFLDSQDRTHWDVLFPSRRFKIGDMIELPGGIRMRLAQKGRPQKVETSVPLEESYFEKVGELPLPPYIQKVRDSRHEVGSDSRWYQTAWNKVPGSFAAPTASLHFSQAHLDQLINKGVNIAYLTLHVGLGTFLPVEVEDLHLHKMHFENVEIPTQTMELIAEAKARQSSIWAMGTTVTRALESQARGMLTSNSHGYRGETDLLILPGYDFKVVDKLLTNFHQPESTLLALVMAFAGTEKVKETYQWAIEHKFRLFSYGDLSIWNRA